MFGQSKGFTLVELVIAFSIVAITFPVLLELLSAGLKLYESSSRLFHDLVVLDGKVKEGKLQGVEVSEQEVPDFPRVKEIRYDYGNVYLIRYSVK
jgi:prepilin-type N-terminal cleavage/methylation domain-containing protein